MEAFEEVPKHLLNPNRPQPTIRQRVTMVLRFLVTTFSTISANILIAQALVLKIVLGRKFFRRLCDFVQFAWFDTVFFMLKETKLHMFGQYQELHADDNDKRPRIVICNHSTDVDWLYIWMVAQNCKTSRTGHVKVMLKEGVKRIPLYGWLLDNLDFLWMKRDWDTDREAIQKKIQKLCRDDENLWIVIFPEGMTINTRSLEKSHQFAQAEGRPILGLTLLPRDKGLAAILESTKDLHPEIVDITMAFQSYSGEVPTWEMGYERNNDHLVPNAKKLLAGMAGDVYVDIRTFSAQDVLQVPGGLKQWLDERWIRKEVYLNHFIKHGTFPCDGYRTEIRIPEGSLKKIIAMTVTNMGSLYVAFRLTKEVFRKATVMSRQAYN